ncbi:hypothetical protein ACGFJ7_34090 [Actinoplanes sp. NPDC048988]|uniref:hypothetical protein n=1 Tax=Actinoplanes sp. NPDC048988 TaxID=3363901 RepID=UPI003710ED0B
MVSGAASAGPAPIQSGKSASGRISSRWKALNAATSTGGGSGRGSAWFVRRVEDIVHRVSSLVVVPTSTVKVTFPWWAAVLA